MQLVLFAGPAARPASLLAPQPGWQGRALCSSPPELLHVCVLPLSVQTKTKYIFYKWIRVRLLTAILSHLKRRRRKISWNILLWSHKSKPNPLKLAAPRQYHQLGWRWWSRKSRSRVEHRLEKEKVCFYKDGCVKRTEWWDNPAALVDKLEALLFQAHQWFWSGPGNSD